MMKKTPLSATGATALMLAAGLSILGGSQIHAAPDNTLGMALMAASVSQFNGGTLVRSSGALSATRTGLGHYLVTFDRSVVNCIFVASVGDPNEALQQNGFANAMPYGLVDPPTARVHTRSHDGTLVDTLPFHLIVFCPN